MTDSSIPNNSEDQVNSSDSSDSEATEDRPKIRLSLKKPSSDDAPKSAAAEDTQDNNDSSIEKEPERAKPKMRLRRESVEDSTEEKPTEPLIKNTPPPISQSPKIKEVSGKALVPDIEESPTPKTEAKEKETKVSIDAVKPPAVAPKAKKQSNFGALIKIAAFFLLVAVLFVGAIFLISKTFTADTAEDEAVAQEIIPPDSTSPNASEKNVIGNIQNPYTDPDSDFGEIHTDPDSPFAGPTATKEPSPSIIRNVRTGIFKDPSPSQQPSSEESVTEESSTPQEEYTPSAIVQKPTPDPAVVDFLNGLVVQGVKSKGDRQAALLNGKVYNLNSTVSVDLGVNLIKVDGYARQIIFKDKNGVRYRKPY